MLTLLNLGLKYRTESRSLSQKTTKERKLISANVSKTHRSTVVAARPKGPVMSWLPLSVRPSYVCPLSVLCSYLGHPVKCCKQSTTIGVINNLRLSQWVDDTCGVTRSKNRPPFSGKRGCGPTFYRNGDILV